MGFERAVQRKLMTFLRDNELLGHEQLDAEGKPTITGNWSCRLCEIMRWLGMDKEETGHELGGKEGGQVDWDDVEEAEG